MLSFMQMVIGLILGAPLEAKNNNINADFYVAEVSRSIPSFEVVENAQMPGRSVPFYSQFKDITSPKWKKVGCGIASLAMIIDFHKPGVVHVDTLLQEGISSGAFLDGAGWIHKGLVNLGERYGLSGASYDFGRETMDYAYSRLEEALKKGPVIASVYYKFEPGHPIPHLAVINEIVGNTVYYNDPAEKSGNGKISVSDFKRAWKKRFISLNSAI